MDTIQNKATAKYLTNYLTGNRKNNYVTLANVLRGSFNSIKKKRKVSKIEVIVIYLIQIGIIVGAFIFYNYWNNKYLTDMNNNNGNLCLDIYKGNNYNINFNKIPYQYKNTFYNEKNPDNGPQYIDLTLKDFYILGSNKSYLSCGPCDGKVSYDSIKHILKS